MRGMLRERRPKKCPDTEVGWLIMGALLLCKFRARPAPPSLLPPTSCGELTEFQPDQATDVSAPQEGTRAVVGFRNESRNEAQNTHTHTHSLSQSCHLPEACAVEFKNLEALN